MVLYKEVQASNARIATTLPIGLVAIFVGATSGIGEYTLKQFAKYTREPRVYFVGRSQEAGDRIQKECKALNSNGSFTFIKADTSLIRNVDELCQSIKTKEKKINLLFMSIGTLDFYKNTSEGIRLAAALTHFARARFIQNLLPELQAATSLKRVVSVFAGTKEGALDVDDLNAEKLGLTGIIKARGHAASTVTLGMEMLAKQAPDVSFVHDFPGPVKSGIGREMPGLVGIVVRALATIVGPLFNIPTSESGAYHLFFATSAKYAPQSDAGSTSGVPLGDSVSAARGTDGKVGSGMYSINEKGESASPSVERLLAGLRNDGTSEKLWKHTESEWRRITESVLVSS